VYLTTGILVIPWVTPSSTTVEPALGII
jgi:hypothetical protein